MPYFGPCEELDAASGAVDGGRHGVKTGVPNGCAFQADAQPAQEDRGKILQSGKETEDFGRTRVPKPRQPTKGK